MTKPIAYLQEVMRTQGPLSRKLAAMDIFTCLDEFVPWLAARRFDGLVIKEMEDAWLLIIKAKYKKKHQVAFVFGDNIEECMVRLAHELLFDLIVWREDKWWSMRRDKTGIA